MDNPSGCLYTVGVTNKKRKKSIRPDEHAIESSLPDSSQQGAMAQPAKPLHIAPTPLRNARCQAEDLITARPELIAPWSWCFTRFSTALAATLSIYPALWLILVGIRKTIYISDSIYWNHELTLVLAFSAAGATSLFLARLLGRLVSGLSALHPDMAGFLEQLRGRFHDWRWLVPGPAVLAAVAISIRYITASEFTPFESGQFDAIFSGWLLIGFFFMLNATVLCGRYTEMVKRIAHEVAVGKLGRAETSLLSRFYLNVAILATIHFGFCVIIIYTLHLVYTYRGLMWPAYALLRWYPGLTLAGQLTMLLKDPLFFELAIFFGLIGLASLAPLLYFTYPQWEVHKLLDARRKSLLEGTRKRLDEIETQLRPDSPESDFELYERRHRVVETIEQMPSWPFSGYGTASTIFLIALPGLLVLLKEVFLQAVVQLLFS